MPSPNNVLTADSYVQDGLVFQLDGIDYGGIDGRWIDKKGNLVFDASKITHLNKAFSFNGTNKYASLIGAKTLVISNDYLCEIVFETQPSTYGIILSNPAPYNYSIVVYGSKNAYFGNQYVNPLWHFTENKSIISHQNNTCIANGVLCNRASSDYWNVGSTLCIGNRNGGGASYNFQGLIYAIRIYSRQLSDREILINQKIDNARFQLGLDIPDEVLPATRSLSLSEPFELLNESESEHELTNVTSDER